MCEHLGKMKTLASASRITQARPKVAFDAPEKDRVSKTKRQTTNYGCDTWMEYMNVKVWQTSSNQLANGKLVSPVHQSGNVACE